MPECASLAENDVAWHDKLGGAAFGAETLARALGGTVGAALRGVGGRAGKNSGRCGRGEGREVRCGK